jgi:hypothetical protein
MTRAVVPAFSRSSALRRGTLRLGVGATLVAVAACGGEDDRQERLEKLRALGVGASPLVSSPSTDPAAPKMVELTVFAAVPPGQTVQVEPFVDKSSPLLVQIPADQVAIAPASATYEEHPNLRLYTVHAKVPVPPAAAFATRGGAGQVRYGFLLTSGDEQEEIVGNFLVVPDGSPELAWKDPKADLVTPALGAAVPNNGRTDLAATLDNPNDEDLKVGWFIDAGKIVNRRAHDTTWKTPDAGAHTLIVTVHGKKSRGFGLTVRDVTVE